ncbi:MULTISPECIES: ABC transporter permease [unclassified Micromonospora]|uniref:ABC transporter permease n=1 Tax=unclassified Micromonospora TaxID=2617518 RepID=UPI0003EEC6F4|nr:MULTISPECIES: ABC transporter permease [unclassified Micromonospora]EWM67888.1 peptide ABC transporter permease [Micromonospora sp. M42]MCK1808170.1 ABC transporter permease [Micromonospora sp. R42106]MCK1832806.1 ABC transporter permease [Micromonospora sp. R42003]MCK1844198.1 ABC transporter permease [Micromonospora sp. R42004]MCM1017617.1 ABC transporter permease [Micromonospora sp. XM-20-01]
MVIYFVRRLAILAVSLFAASILVFTMLSLLPGDQAQAMLGVNATPEALEALREQFGTNRPFTERYLDWAGGLIRGDFGISPLSGVSVGSEIGDKLGVTVPLILAGMTLALLIAVPLGILAAVKSRTAIGTALSALSQVGIAVPSFWLGILLITVFAVKLQWLPAGGFTGWDDFGGTVRALLMPALVLGVAQGAILMRYVRSAVVEVMQEDFIQTARAKGLSRSQALTRHALRNAAIPVITVLGLQLATLLIGTVVIENVFGLPGLGRMLLQDVGNRDLLKVQGTVMVLTAAVLLINFVVDVVYHAVDPRLRSKA